ncbi:MAG: putative RNA-binding protein (virulence factor B family) [Gammaproteobacteria bacterium]|jgi:predicted RNA-binding protein (virulence factor B family)
MAQLGQFNLLRVIKQVDFGYYVDGEQFGQVLLPKKQAPEDIEVDQDISVFLYTDSEDRIVSTTLKPKALVGECAYLKVIETNRVGAFLDWGLPKDLLVPFNEQLKPMQEGYSYTVYLFIDDASERIAATTRLDEHLPSTSNEFEPGQSVELMIYSKSDLGFKAVINGTHLGQLYNNEVFCPLHYGEKLNGYIKQLRDDGRIDLALQLSAHIARDELSETILKHLKDNNGISNLTDKSLPSDISNTFGVSKKTYKKALGLLYKNKQIKIEKHQITLN